MADAAVPGPDSPIHSSVPGGPYGTVPVEESMKPNYPPPPTYVQEHPPSYTDVTDLHAPPPSYESLYGELRQVRTPGGFAYFIRRALGIIIGTFIFAIVVAIISLIPIAMIVIGSLNIHNCRAEPYIPIYLIVGGVFGILKSLTNFYYRAKHRQRREVEGPEANVDPNPFDGVLNCFLLAWFIAGSVWIYRTSPDFEHMDSGLYCDKVTYYFAFALITASYLCLVIFVLVMCCGACIACCSAVAGGGRTNLNTA